MKFAKVVYALALVASATAMYLPSEKSTNMDVANVPSVPSEGLVAKNPLPSVVTDVKLSDKDKYTSLDAADVHNVPSAPSGGMVDVTDVKLSAEIKIYSSKFFVYF